VGGKDVGELLGGGSRDGRLSRLECSIGGSKDGEAIAAVLECLKQVGLSEGAGELSCVESSHDRGEVSGDGQNGVDGLNKEVLVGRSVLSGSERDVSSSLDNRVAVVTGPGEHDDLGSIVRQLHVLRVGEEGVDDGVAIFAYVADPDGAVEDVVLQGCDERLGADVAELRKGVIRWSQDGLVAALLQGGDLDVRKESQYAVLHRMRCHIGNTHQSRSVLSCACE